MIGASYGAGVHVDAVTGAVKGCKIRSLTTNQAAAKDGRLKVGDFLVAINEESMRGTTSAQARAILRRADAQSSDIRYR